MRNIRVWSVLGLLTIGTVAQAQTADTGGKSTAPATNADTALLRGERLSVFGGCHDCHTPKIMTANGPQPDASRLLSGHPAKTPLPVIPPGVISPTQWGALATNDLTAWAGPWGISFAANLTPDPSGLGPWTEQQFIRTMRTGKHLGVGRALLPPMPWFDSAPLTDEELKALFRYLRSLKPISNTVPPPVPPQGSGAG